MIRAIEFAWQALVTIEAIQGEPVGAHIASTAKDQIRNICHVFISEPAKSAELEVK